MSQLCDVEEVGNDSGHQTAGVVFIIIGEGQLLEFLKQILTHIPFHLRAQNMPLRGDIIAAGRFDQIHDHHAGDNPAQTGSDHFCRVEEEVLNTVSEDQGIGNINEGDNHRTQHVKIESLSIRLIK